MKILVERDPFAEAISAAMRAAGKNETIPILSNLLLAPASGRIEISGTSLDVHLRTSVAAEIEGDAEPITVRADALSGIVSQMPKGAQLTLESEGGHAGATIRSGRSRYKLLTLPASDFPGSMEVREPTTFTLPGGELAAALSATKFCMSRDRSRPYLHGVQMASGTDEHAAFGGTREARLTFAATDGFELARASMPLPQGAGKMASIIIPDISIPEIIRLATDADEVRVDASGTLTRFVFGETEFTTKLIDGTFPGYERAIPADGNRRMIVDVDGMAAALQRLRTIDDGSQFGSPLAVKIEGSKLSLSLSNHSMGDASEEIEVEWDNAPFEIVMRTRGLLNVLDAIQSDLCLFRFTDDPMRPPVIQPWRNNAIDAGRTYICMPLDPRNPAGPK